MTTRDPAAMSYTARLSSMPHSPQGDRARDVPAIRDYMLAGWSNTGIYVDPQGIGRWDATYLPDARLAWMSAQLLDLVEDVRDSVPADLTIAEASPIFPIGLVVFQRPLLGIAVAPLSDMPLQVRAVAWGPINARNDIHATQGIGISSYDLVDLGGYRVWWPLGRSDWFLDETAGRVNRNHAVRDNVTDEFVASAVDDRNTLTAVWQVARMTRHVSHETWEPKPRKSRRKSARPLDRVDVYRWKDASRVSADGGDGRESRYTHQWWVRPHFRWQPCGPGRAERRLIVVDGHVKGPAGAPLRTRDRVLAVDHLPDSTP